MKFDIKKVQMFTEELFADRKKLLKILSLLLCLGILFMLFPIKSTNNENVTSEKQTSRPKTDEKKANIKQTGKEENSDLVSTALQLESDLKEILATVLGDDDVKVLVTYESSEENITAIDTEEETDNETHTQSQSGEEESSDNTNTQAYKVKKEHIYQEIKSSGEDIKQPVIVKTIMPKVQGVLIVTKNQLSYQQQVDICTAVSMVAGVGVHKINIIQGE